jgi:hypothetical protein
MLDLIGQAFYGVLTMARPRLRDAAVAAARELGVFAALAVPRDIDGLARAIGVQPRRLSKLCDVLVLEGIVARDRDGRMSLAAPPPEPSQPFIGGMWRELPESVREDRPIVMEVAYDAGVRFDGRIPSARGSSSRELWASEVTAGLPPHAALLDAAGRGDADTIAWLDSGDARRATLVIPSGAAETARERLAEYGGRATVVRGELLAPTTHIPGGHQLGLLADLLHDYDPATCAALVGRVARGVVPGGAVVVKDRDAATPTGVLLSLHLTLYTDAGEVWPAARIAGWLRDAGVHEVRTLRLAGSPWLQVVWGIKA